MNVLLNPVNIRHKHVVGVDSNTSFETPLLTNFVNTFKIFSLVKIWDITSIENVVDVFKLLLVDNLSIDKQEGSGFVLDTTLKHTFFGIFSPVCHTVALDNFNLEAFVSCHESSKSSQ